MARTSATHPLHINELQLAEGALGLTFCPGKKGESVYGEPWERDLETDLDVIRKWGASTVVTLMESHELESLGVPDLGDSVARRGMMWIHAPIVDVSVPDKDFERRWNGVQGDIRRSLSDSGKVAIHCRGGLGRTGLVAARILVEEGCDAREAIKRVRQARPGAIETQAQEDYVLGLR